MKKKLWIPIAFLVLFLPLSNLCAQQELHFDHGCNYKMGRTAGNYTLFDPSKEAEKMVDEILEKFRIRTRPFTLKKSDVDNAQATSLGNNRYLLYSGEYLRSTTINAQTKWAAKGIFAHEIAHHVLLHDFTEKDPVKRRKFEFEADAWAAQVLARMGASRDAALSALNTLSQGGGSSYYPTKEARIENMASAFDEEFDKISNDDDILSNSKRTPFQIDAKSYNRWSIVSQGAITSYYTDESVVIDIKISTVYANKKFTILLCSNDPYMPVRTVKGVGAYLPYSNSIQIVWNFQIDGVNLNNAIRPNQLRVLVYESNNLPPVRSEIGGKVVFSSLGIVGIGVVGYSFKLRSDAKNHYDSNYAVSRIESDYQTADKMYVNSQYILIGGGILATVGTALVINKIKKQKEAKKAVCFQKQRWEVEPLLASDGNLGAGIRVRF